MKIEIVLSGASGIIGASKEVDSIDNYDLNILFKEAWKQAEWDTHDAELHIDGVYIAKENDVEKFGDFNITKYKGIYHFAFDEGDAELQTGNVKHLKRLF